MTDSFLKDLAAGPLGDPSKTFLPRGRKTGQNKRNPAELELFRADRAAKKDRLAREDREHLAELFDYYATAPVPFARVVVHIGRDETRVREGLEARGRKLDPAEVAQFEVMRAVRLAHEKAAAAKAARSSKGKGRRK